MLSLFRVACFGVSLFTLTNVMINDARAAVDAQTTPLVSPLVIASGSAIVFDMTDNHLLYSSNADKVMPIASLSKLMTAIVVLDAKQPLDEIISVDIHETPELRGVFSRVRVGSEISRRNMLLLALMSSENRAAASLAHHYPGGYPAFIAAMNAKARSLGMMNTHYVEPTGLSFNNVSTARDLSKLLIDSQQYPLLTELSTTHETMATFSNPPYTLPFRNTNHLVYRPDWTIQLTKTGFTNPAGHCLVMRTVINHRPVGLVVLDAYGKYTHFADAGRIRNWLETGQASPLPSAVFPAAPALLSIRSAYKPAAHRAARANNNKLKSHAAGQTAYKKTRSGKPGQAAAVKTARAAQATAARKVKPGQTAYKKAKAAKPGQTAYKKSKAHPSGQTAKNSAGDREKQVD
ncbi:D-alanyl-D-alanine endopeptidase [Enterobacteriales bacterium SAP-6]|uniref:D-alanyl-D-alanine endopeptidase n=1 Tax=Acerihabitans arboris TaxID=2691583 RepID=A0A845SJP7_9GAMM|nr:D-alanyl-D-alanine endopeptidase [Acerihabitans arboris]NDL62838.1 D-alanyl-D-alanine endopeptidase [Acerihabitans arboris]